MLIIKDLNQLPPLPQPIALTIGNFDGVHLGHQYLLQELKKAGTAVVLTFSNHSSEILSPHIPYMRLTSLEEKLSLLKQQGIFCTIVLEFTQQLSQTSYDRFIQNLYQFLPFSTLILGEQSHLGKKREGNENGMKILAKELNFNLLYLPKFKKDEIPVSSQRIRSLYSQGLKEEAKELLNHF